MPRSGTTWIGKILDSHPDTLYRHEPDSWGALNAIPLMADLERSGEYEDRIRAFVGRLPDMNQTKISGSVPVFRKSYESRLAFMGRTLAIRGAKAVAKLTGECPVPRLVSRERRRGAIPVWKSIESVGRLGVVMRSVPGSRAVHIIRHPCGHIASVLAGEARRKFTADVAQSEDFGFFDALVGSRQSARYQLDSAAFRSMSPIERLAWRWVLMNEKAMDDLAEVSGGETLVYEDLCRAPLETAAAVFDRLGLAFDEQVQAFLADSTGSESGSYYGVHRKPLKAAYKWRDQLTPEQIQAIRAVVRDTAPGALYEGDY